MVRCSNCFLTLLNFVTLVASIILIMMAMSFNMHSNESLCQKELQKPLMILGVTLLVLSLMGIVGAACHVSFLLWIYLFLLFLVIIGMMIYSIFSIVYTLNHLDDKKPEKGDWEDKLQEYSQWMKNRMPGERHWDKIKSCMVDAKFCNYLPRDRSEEFYKTKMNPIQSGCCKPPTYCNFQFQNATSWIVPKIGPVVGDPDCKAWSNEQKEMCYNCNSCKKSFFDNLKKYYKHSSLISFCIFVILSIVYSIGCCALTNNSYRERAYVYHGYRPYGPGPYGYP
ncbi:tetraspanin-8-like [Lycium barbarum]|uniref:tetraspanin-8-like n=1 Tax=Lycium barbarum TaxID=112863 RepID=UPI00293E2EAC|nr:tetraspanin-8-like [Lycium barbarum]